MMEWGFVLVFICLGLHGARLNYIINRNTDEILRELRKQSEGKGKDGGK